MEIEVSNWESRGVFAVKTTDWIRGTRVKGRGTGEGVRKLLDKKKAI